MNALCYKVIFSKRLGALVAVGENATSQGKSASGAGSRSVEVPMAQATGAGNYFVGSLKVLFTSSVLACLVANPGFAAPAIDALPTQGVVQTGAATISTNGAAMTINQATQKASINWNSFNIGSQASVNVVQNNASSVLLNRVMGNDPSQIFGKFTANGQVILINPNGIVFGKGGSVTASAFTASTFGMSEEDFKKGKYKYDRNGSTAGVTVEQGARIQTTTPGGFVALLGAEVNNQGNISTKQGAVVMASGESVALPSTLTDSVGVPLSGKVRLELAPSTINASVENGGVITTEGGQVLMQAAAVVDAVSHVANANVTNTGTIDTTGEQGGRVDLFADHGTVRVSGTVKANSTNGTAGGSVFIGRDEDTNTLAAMGDASGARIESKGSFVETSGEFIKVDGARVIAKDWLLDPFNITIVDNNGSTTTGATNLPSYTPSTTSTIKASDIVGVLTDGTSVTISTAGNGNEAGNITVNSGADIIKTSNGTASLTLRADNNITVKAKIGAEGDAAGLNINLQAGQTTNTGGITIAAGGSLDAKGGDIKMQTQGGTINVNSTAAVKGKNIAIDNSGGTIANDFSSISQGGKTSGLNTGVALNGGGILATNKLSILGVSGSGWGLFSSAALIEGKTLNITGKTSGTNALRFDSRFNSSPSTVRALENGGDSTITGISTGGIGSGGSGAALILGSNKFDAKEGSAITLEGQATTASKNDFLNMRGLRLDSGTNTTDGVVTFRGVSKNSDGLLLINNQVVKANSGTLTLDGATQATENVNSQNGFNTYAGGSIEALNSSNLIIKGTAANTNGTMSETGAYLGFNITGSKDSTLKVIGNATSANNSSGVVMNAAINGFKEVTILGSRPASSTGNAVLINSDLKANGNVLIQANGGQITQSNRTLSSANGWITIDNSNSQNVDPSTGKINEKGTATAQVNAITLSGVVSAGTDKNLNIHGQGSAAGVVIASGRLSAGRDVNITGEGVNERGVLSYEAITNVKPNIEAKNGDVNITGKSTSQTAISLESATGLVTAGNSIVLKGDKQYLGTLINTEGTVTIQATTPNRSIALGADDAPEKLGISQPELNQITAKNLIVGNTSSNGKISVETGITTKIATGDLTLQTGGDIEFKAALNVGVDVSGNTPSKKLTLNAGGKVAQDASAAIKATELQLAGGSGTYLLNNPSNTIGKISGSAMKIEFKNIGDLNVGSATETLDAKDGLTILTGGNLDIQNKITNTNNNDVILAAGYGHAAESGLGNNILTNGRAIVSNGSRSIRLYTGSTTGTGKLANLHSSLDKLDLEAGVTSTDTKQNTMTGASFLDAQSIEGGANVQAFFREKVAFTTTFNAPNAPVTKNYGEFGTKNEGTQLADTVKSALKGANTGNASVATANGNAFQIKKSTLIDNMTFDGGKALATTDQSFSTSNHLKASDTTYKSSKMTTNNSAYTLGDVAAETVQVKVTTAVAPKPPTPVVTPTDSTRVKVPVGAANPFQLASAEDLADEVCSANSLENCYCEESPLTPNVDICYEPKTSGKGPAR